MQYLNKCSFLLLGLNIEMSKLYPQTLIILWVSGIITQQEKGSTTSIQSIDTHLSHVTTLLPASTEDPGMSLKTGNNN